MMSKRSPKITPDESAEMVRRYIAGETITDIARSLGRGRSTVSEHVNPNAGLTPIKIGSFEEPLSADPREQNFLDALAENERLPAEQRVRSFGTPKRYQAEPTRSGEGSQSAWAAEN